MRIEGTLHRAEPDQSSPRPDLRVARAAARQHGVLSSAELEADGPHHDDPLERAADRERQRILEAHGDRMIRVTWAQAVAQPDATLRRISDAGAPRAVS